MAADLKSLQQELTSNLGRAEHYRKIIRWVKTPIFILFLLWIVLMFSTPFLLPYLVQTGKIDPSASLQQLMTSCFIVTAVTITVLSFFFTRMAAVFGRIEQETISRIIRELFPAAKMHEKPQPVSDNILKNSLFFGRSDQGGERQALVFSSLELPSDDRKLEVVDMGILHERAGASALIGIYAEFFRQIFKSRAEMASYLFRGMFAWAELEKRIPGSILIMPDHLEDKLGYMAKHLQTLKNRSGLELIQLEDIEFERYFAVYTTDEVLARYVLTPAMMRDLTELREKFGRDIMISFNANRFSIAVAMPDGFLNLRGKALKNGHIVEEIYNDILATQSILTQIKLDKIA